MSRGLNAPLSPNEERTLIRLARGGRADDVADCDLKHLRALSLVEDDREWRLTLTGKKRLARLVPRAQSGARSEA
jgi:hypothetical protein